MAFPIPIIGPIISAISTVAGSFLETRKIKAQGKVEVAKAKVNGEIKRAQTHADAEAQWDQTVAEGMKTSWKDEYWVIVLSIPAIMCFIPGLAVYVEKGFDALNKTPSWYQAAFGLAVAASFGFKKFIEYISKKNGS